MKIKHSKIRIVTLLFILGILLNTGGVYAQSTEDEENIPPTISFLEPQQDLSISPGELVTIIWQDDDTDDNATISLALDVDNDPLNENHYWIIQGLEEDPDEEGDKYIWETSEVPVGQYYLWAIISDGSNEPVYSISEFPIIVEQIEEQGVELISTPPPIPSPEESSANNLLFTDANISFDIETNANDPFIIRSRFVQIQTDLLLSADGDVKDQLPMEEITLNLFPDTTFTAIVEKIEQNSTDSHSWIGKLKENEEGYFYLVITDGVFIAHIASLDGIYEVSYVNEDLYQVVQIDQSQFQEASPIIPDIPAEMLTQSDTPGSDSGDRIDVMILYTDDARAAEGGTAAMNSRINLAVTETNDSYANSGINQRINLVYKGEISYTETGDGETDLYRLQRTTDRYIDSIHTLRDTYKADLVTLVVETSNACGIGFMMASPSTSFSSYAFTVVKRSGCFTGYYSYGHEMGHNMGAHHDAYTNPTSLSYPYGQGYVYLPSRWRTVMAYNDQCAATSPYTYCTRLKYWSNPSKTYGGAAMGISNSSENYKVLNNTASIVANFRDSGSSSASTKYDFDGDGDADIGIFRPSNNLFTVRNQFYQIYGVIGDIPVPADYDGDGDTDVAIFRPTTGLWAVNGQFYANYGKMGDIPIPADYDGDGAAELAIYRPSNSLWAIKDGAYQIYGVPGDIPVPEDYDGDGDTDIAVFRPANGLWAVKDQFYQGYGKNGDTPIPADYNGDGQADLAIYRASNSLWAVKDQFYQIYGVSGDIPVPADYNGDGKTDIGIFRPSNALWAIKDQFYQIYGTSGDIALEKRLIGQVSADTLYVKLTWGANPSDMDAHLGIDTSSTNYEIYYGNRGNPFGIPYAYLDRDDTNSYGPETIGITKLMSGTYYDYVVVNLSTDTTLSNSQAKVEIFKNGNLYRTYNVPAGSGSNQWWYVFYIDGTTGQIYTMNTFLAGSDLPDSLQQNAVDLKK